MNIVICGAGNAAQTLIPLLASDPQHRVTVYAPLTGEADRLNTAMPDAGLEVTFATGQRKQGKPHLITANPAAAAADVQMVLLALPSFAHGDILSALAPHLPNSAWIGALPARGGFDWQVRSRLPGHLGVIFGLQTLPWACRIQEWGRRVEVLGTKAQVDLAAWPAAPRSPVSATVAATVSEMIGVPLNPIDYFLALTLANTGQIIHPGIMYGLFSQWDGQPFPPEQAPLFYGGVDDRMAAVLQAMSDEVQTLCRGLEQAAPGLDLGSVASVGEWLLRSYPDQIEDTSSLRSAFNTNRAYAGLRAPVVKQANGLFVPDFTARYLTEDIPYSLLVTQGIAELAGVPTPTISRVIDWAQTRMGKHYLVNGQVAGPDVAHSRAPQHFGITNLADLLLCEGIRGGNAVRFS